ncbi:MAG: Rho termination factor [Phycisphaerales bacterium JB052]
MPEHNQPSIKDDDQYHALRDKGDNKQAAYRDTGTDSNAQPTDRPNTYEDWSREELYERAQELDLEGRSDMDKPALVAALRGKRYGDQN